MHQPTGAELKILDLLWSSGEATVREIHEKINSKRGLAYTTTLKILQIMNEKGLVRRNVSNRAHIYKAAVEREETERAIAEELLQNVFRGSASRLMLRVLEAKPSSAEELAAIRKIIEQAEEE